MLIPIIKLEFHPTQAHPLTTTVTSFSKLELRPSPYLRMDGVNDFSNWSLSFILTKLIYLIGKRTQTFVPLELELMRILAL